MKVKVTQECIDRGRPLDAFSCPLVRGIRESLAALGISKCTVSVASEWTTISVNNCRPLSIPLPTDACRFRKDVDDGKIVYPFEFDLPYDPPCSSEPTMVDSDPYVDL